MSGVRSYRKKPVEIDAMQWDGTRATAIDIITWINSHGADIAWWTEDKFFIQTLEGVMTVSPQDFVIRGIVGEFYACKPDVFEASYDPV